MGTLLKLIQVLIHRSTIKHYTYYFIVDSLVRFSIHFSLPNLKCLLSEHFFKCLIYFSPTLFFYIVSSAMLVAQS